MTQTDPLRKVIARAMMIPPDLPPRILAMYERKGEMHPAIPLEIYECGHTAPQKSDIYGPTFAVRRRCHQCTAGMPPHLTRDEMARAAALT